MGEVVGRLGVFVVEVVTVLEKNVDGALGKIDASLSVDSGYP